jgi:putative phage-type endonuclease
MTSQQAFKTIKDNFNDAVWVGDAPSGSDEWHAMRRTGIGGSDVGTIMGLNPFESAFGLWAKRSGQIVDPPVDNWSVRFGNAFEEPILKMWSVENPEWEVFRTGTWRHPKFDYLVANPDALARHRETGEWIVVEVKTSRSFWDDVPPAYRAQVMHYMDVMGCGRAVIVAVAGWQWEERWIDFDQFECDVQRSAASRFWDHLTQVVQPEWDGSKATYEAQRQLNPFIEDDEVDLGDAGRNLLRAQTNFDTAERKLMKAKSEVLGLMGSARHGVVDEVRVASRQARGNGTPWLVIKKGSK